jgi:hypothetical protein
LKYDGTAFFNGCKPLGDSTNSFIIPLYVNASNVTRYIDTAGFSILVSTSGFKATLAKNFIVLNQMSPVTKIDKLLHSITLVFDALATNESIRVDYSIDNRANWTTLATISKTTEGTNTKREIILPGAVVYSDIWIRVFIGATASTTPNIRDLIVAYKAIPDYRNRWVLRLNANDAFSLLNRQKEQRSGKDLMEELWTARQLKQTVLFEDLDYRETTLVSSMPSGATSATVASTRQMPRAGRIRVVSGGVAEEMIYTSAMTNKILGITRARRGTRARAYAVGTTVKNDYDVYIDDMNTHISFTDENKTEGIVQVSLLEA